MTASTRLALCAVACKNGPDLSGRWCTGRAKKHGHFILWLVTLELLTTSAPIMAQINVIAFLTLPRNLLETETTLEKKWRHLSDHSDPDKCL